MRHGRRRFRSSEIPHGVEHLLDCVLHDAIDLMLSTGLLREDLPSLRRCYLLLDHLDDAHGEYDDGHHRSGPNDHPVQHPPHRDQIRRSLEGVSMTTSTTPSAPMSAIACSR